MAFCDDKNHDELCEYFGNPIIELKSKNFSVTPKGASDLLFATWPLSVDTMIEGYGKGGIKNKLFENSFI